MAVLLNPKMAFICCGVKLTSIKTSSQKIEKQNIIIHKVVVYLDKKENTNNSKQN